MSCELTRRSAKLALAISLLGLTALTGCRESEENRVITLEKGVYHGQQDHALTEDQRRELRARGMKQQF
ncbi:MULTISPECIES: hypothetical protein [Stappiaceae]|uniref:Lipoprotein n=1 Tax=Roseibium polysiphoniae TaxID=2571221 RepID=A0A944GQX8_9HYPH|nr:MULTISPECIES: hypothetical protein [Stappiaceae]MBS8258907.1 hypothetical protein [Roseibium polysiphoniae]